MNKSIKTTGIIASSLLLATLPMSLMHIPNHALLIVAAILIMITAGPVLFLRQQNKDYPERKGYNFQLFISEFIFIPALFYEVKEKLIIAWPEVPLPGQSLPG